MLTDWIKWIATHARDALTSARRLPGLERGARAAALLMNCRSARRHLSDAHDGLLPPLEHALLRAHVTVCSECGPVAESLDTTIELLGRLRHEPGSAPARRTDRS